MCSSPSSQEPQVSLIAVAMAAVPTAMCALHDARRPEHPALPDDEGGGAEAGAAAQLPPEEGGRRRVQGDQEAQGLQLHHAHAHRRHHGKHDQAQPVSIITFFEKGRGIILFTS